MGAPTKLESFFNILLQLRLVTRRIGEFTRVPPGSPEGEGDSRCRGLFLPVQRVNDRGCTTAGETENRSNHKETLR